MLNGEKFAIDAATFKDIAAVTELLYELYGVYSYGELLEETQAHFANDSQAFFLAKSDGCTIGVAQVSRRLEYVEGRHDDVCGYLEAIYVKERWRRKGVASALVSACETWAVAIGCTIFASDCELDNLDSLRFHLKIGFAETSRSINFAKRLSQAGPPNSKTPPAS
jgi:aminoglycoside 6'-N-acetyltransferase I